MTTLAFPAGFTWGVATASYQIEGAVQADGRGPSIWDTFSHTPGMVLQGHTGDIACDHYHRWPDDIKLMQDLGISAYRFSMAWPRIFPQGTGRANAKGLAFYDRLVDGLLAAGITPYVTLYHWDLPQALEDKGGWTSRATVDAFVTYADTVARKLGDRVKNWITFNEPWVSAFLGYYEGRHAPGLTDLTKGVQASHHLLLAHGRTVPLLRAASKGAQVGITLNLHPVHPATPSAADRAAARAHDGYANRWFLDPVYGRGYPKDMEALLGRRLPAGAAADTKEIGAPIDFLGVNFYFPQFTRAAPANELGFESLPPTELAARGHELTTMGWPVVPCSFFELLTRVNEDYAPKAMYITENGAASPDQLVNGQVDDPQRITYLDAHLRAIRQAICAGVPLRGYFLWTLMDNFEWGYGYTQRFGIVYNDVDTQARVPKGSFHFYKRVIAHNGV